MGSVFENACLLVFYCVQSADYPANCTLFLCINYYCYWIVSSISVICVCFAASLRLSNTLLRIWTTTDVEYFVRTSPLTLCCLGQRFLIIWSNILCASLLSVHYAVDTQTDVTELLPISGIFFWVESAVKIDCWVVISLQFLIDKLTKIHSYKLQTTNKLKNCLIYQ